MTRQAWGEEFRGAPGFLDSPTYGLPSVRQMAALRELFTDWEAGAMDAVGLDASVAAARQAFADLAGVAEDTVTMGATTSGLLGLVAAAVPDGATVATFSGEFSSVSAPFQAQAGRGVTVTALSAGELEDRAGEFDVVAVSLVQSADGRLLDVARLRRSLGDRTRVVVDATQAMGWKELDLGWADAVVASAYKWLLCPRGLAWMSVTPEWAETLTPHAANWYATDSPWENTYTLPLPATTHHRRFDISPTWSSVCGAGVAMPWLAGLDMTEVETHCVGLAAEVREACGMPETGSAIVALTVPHDPQALTDAGIRAGVRAGRTRVGFHLYNTREDVDTLLGALGV